MNNNNIICSKHTLVGAHAHKRTRILQILLMLKFVNEINDKSVGATIRVILD